MSFKEALQQIITEHNVRLIPGIAPGFRAVMVAYKLDADGRVIAQQEIPAMGPERKEP